MINTIRIIFSTSLFFALAGLASSQLSAADTDIFGLTPVTPFEEAKVLFMVDTSASMRCNNAQFFADRCDEMEHQYQRITQVSIALRTLINSSADGFHLGIGRYTDPGGSIIYPVRRLSDFSGSNPNADVGAEGTNQFTLELPVINPNDDAIEVTRTNDDGETRTEFVLSQNQQCVFYDRGLDEPADYLKAVSEGRCEHVAGILADAAQRSGLPAWGHVHRRKLSLSGASNDVDHDIGKFPAVVGPNTNAQNAGLVSELGERTVRFLSRGQESSITQPAFSSRDALSFDLAEAVTVGLRFPHVFVPAGATITNAELVVYLKGEDSPAELDAPLDFFIDVEETLNAAPYSEGNTVTANPGFNSSNAAGSDSGDSSTNYQSSRRYFSLSDTQRQRSISARESWTAGEFKTYSITDQVQKVVGQSGWSAGAAMALKLTSPGVDSDNDAESKSASVRRRIYTREGHSSAPPRLRITYTIDSNANTMMTQFSGSKVLSDDDWVEDQNGQRVNGALVLAPQADESVYLRFNQVRFPAPDEGSAVIKDLRLNFSLARSTAVAKTISIGVLADETSNSVIQMTIPAGSAADRRFVSPNLAGLAAQVSPGDPITFILTNAEGLEFYAAEDTALTNAQGEVVSKAARVTLSWEGVYNSAVLRTVRYKLLEQAELFVTNGETPLAGSLLEAAQYFVGGDVEYGINRGSTTTGNDSFALKRQNSDDFVSELRFPFSQKRANRESNPLAHSVNSTVPGCWGTEFGASIACQESSVEAGAKYISPVSATAGPYLPEETACHNAHVFMLTDGIPSTEGSSASGKSLPDLVRTLTSVVPQGEQAPAVDCLSSDGSCGQDIAEYLNDYRDVRTHAIAFFDDAGNSEAITTLRNLTQNEGKQWGLFADTVNADGLLAILENGVNQFGAANTSFVAPAIAINQNSRLQHIDRLYYSLFTPTGKLYWGGNLKQYRLNEDGNIVDKNNNRAITEDSDGVAIGFKPGSTELWNKSATADGSGVLAGGVARLMSDIDEDPARSRTIRTFAHAYTKNRGLFKPANDSQAEITAQSNTITEQTVLAIDPSRSAAAAQNIADWINGDKGTDSPIMGAPMHSKAVLVNYGFRDENSAEISEESFADPDDQYNSLFVSTNEGALHAFDAVSGEEIFSFVPPELIKERLPRLVANSEATLDVPIIYGLDATWVPWRFDAWKPTPNGGATRDGIIKDGDDHVYLYGGMRRGGRNYYSLDVTQANTNRDKTASLRWTIRGGLDDTDYTDLGYTWSTPSLAAIRTGSGSNVKVRTVLAFGGGYDPLYDADDSAGEEATMGNRVYFVDAAGGENLLIVDDTQGRGHVDLDYSIPAPLKAVDLTGDGLSDRFYAVDLGGQVWRIDWNNALDASSSRATVTKLANLGVADPERGGTVNDRRLFEVASVSLVSDQVGAARVAVAVISGNRPDPLGTDRQDAMMVVYDSLGPATSTPALFDDLLKVNLSANTGVEVDSSTRGWRIEFNRTVGEKGMGAPVAFNNSLFFTSYEPPSDVVNPQPGQCATQANFGFTFLWAVNLLDGATTSFFTPLGITEPTRRLKVSAGLASGPAILSTKDGYRMIAGTKAIPVAAPAEPVKRVRWKRINAEGAPVADGGVGS